MLDYKEIQDRFTDHHWSIRDEQASFDVICNWLKRNQISEGKRLLIDIGCQKGIYVAELLRLFGDNNYVIGYDLVMHPEILELANKHEKISQ